MTDKLKVIVVGAAGKMGLTVCGAVIDDPDLELVAAVDNSGFKVEWLDSRGLKIRSDLETALAETGADVMVDFTKADAVMNNAQVALNAGAHAVIGTTGLSQNDIDTLVALTAKTDKNILLAPNFAIGAVIMMKVAQRAAKYFDRAEVVEYHHDEKHDAPSGTAILSAEMLAENLQAQPLDEVEKFPGARGATVKGIPVHSVRSPGFVAHQEIILGLKGQVLTIRHDAIDRSSFMPGVVLAIKEIAGCSGFTYGLDKLIDI